MKYRIVPCHCNGSRGTDCDYCGGSGKKKIPVAEVKREQKPETGFHLPDSSWFQFEKKTVVNTDASPSSQPKKEPQLFIVAVTLFKKDILQMEPSSSNLQNIHEGFKKLCKMEEQFYRKTFFLKKKTISRNPSLQDIFYELTNARSLFTNRFGTLFNWPPTNFLERLWQFTTLVNNSSNRKAYKPKKQKRSKKNKLQPNRKDQPKKPNPPTLGDRFPDTFSYFKSMINLQEENKNDE